MPSVTFWAGVGGGTEWYRCGIPGKALARKGWEVRYVTDNDSPVAADVVVLQRVLHPDTLELVGRLQALGCRVVYDIDDWYDGIPDYNPAAGSVDVHRLHRVMQAVDVVTCSTPDLAEGYGHLNETVVLENYLDPGWPPLHQPRTKVHVGWMGSLKWRRDDVDLLRPHLAGFLADHPEVEFVAAGSGVELFKHLGVTGTLIPGGIRPYRHLPAMLAWFDIGLVPLVQNRFNQAKSWCKGLEYNAAGAGVVASPSREYRRFVTPGTNGFLVRKNDWRAALERALTARLDPRGYAARFVIDDHIDRWVGAYRVPVTV